VPSNDFGGQEPGSNAEIAEFCGRDYGVTFPMAGKERVLGEGAHPFYVWAARQRPTETPGWNFHKYLIGRDGRLLGSFATRIAPNDPRLTAAIEQALAGSAG
jgi:glutathione peroxidase